MIVSDVVTRVLKQFGDEASVQIEEADIMRWINDAAKEIAVQNDLGEATASQNSVVGQNIYAMPADAYALRSVYYDMQKLKYLERTAYDEYINTSDPNEEASGTPWGYTRFVDDLLLYPMPDSVKLIKIWYFKRPIAVTLTTDPLPFAEEYHIRIVEYCLQKAYETDEDWDAAGQIRSQFDDGMVKLSGKMENQDQTYYPVITTLPEDSGW